MAHPRVVALVAVVAAASIGGWRLGEARRDETFAAVVDVLDGDTFEAVVGGRRETVRLLGVDTPETVDPDRPVECFGPEASSFTASRLAGRVVRLEYDAERRDPYDRLLAFVVLDGERLNDRLLREGMARLLVIPPNGRHGRTLLEAELAARRNGRGLWGRCGDGA
ncbi:MAG TPA: thermonuclease family protein [Acidimicrobiia bacterium]|nr:thermonuclease family protein [Acidimicrobiia bacterium]